MTIPVIDLTEKLSRKEEAFHSPQWNIEGNMANTREILYMDRLRCV